MRLVIQETYNKILYKSAELKAFKHKLLEKHKLFLKALNAAELFKIPL